MATLVTENFEGGSDGNTITSGNTNFEFVSGGPTFTDDTPVEGDLCMAGSSEGYGGFTFGNRTTVYGRAYIRLDSLGSIVWIWNYITSAPAVATTLRVNANGTIQVMPGQSGNLLVSTGTSITAGQWARIEWAITGTDMQVRLFVGAALHATTPSYDSGTVSWAGATINGSQIGSKSNNDQGVHIDAVAFDDSDWVGPLEQDPATRTGRWVYNGTNLVPVRTIPIGEPGPQTNHIGYIGDSLTRQDVNGSPRVNTSLGDLGWTSQQRRVDGHVGRPITGTNALTDSEETTEAVIDDWRNDDWDPYVWVIALGANNIFQSPSGWPGMINTVCDHLATGGPGRIVYWVNQVYQAESQYDDIAPTFNTSLANTLAARDDGLTYHVIDLHALLRNGRDETGLWVGTDDGRHMTAAGYDLRNELIGTVIGTHAPN